MPAICEAVRRLVRVTSDTRECCDSLAQHGAPKVIWRLVGELNRSAPANEIRRCCAHLLANLARYVTSAVSVVYEAKIWQQILDCMANYKKKETQDLFIDFCTLLAALIRHDDLAMNFASQPKSVERLRKIEEEVTRRCATERKHIIEQKKKKYDIKVKNHSLLIPKSKPIFKLSPEETLELETAIRHLSLLFDLLERTAASAESRQQQLQRQRRLQRERLQLQPPGAPRPPSRRSMMDSGATGCFMVKKHLNRRSDV